MEAVIREYILGREHILQMRSLESWLLPLYGLLNLLN
jgi:hypothetical protein